jgi:hypothetical protein
LLDFGEAVIRRLDPLVREGIGHKPEVLAEWDDIMRDNNSLIDGHEERLPADAESSQIS